MADLETSHATIDHTGLTGVGGSVATDVIFDAKGDLAVGTGANTAAKLTAGSNDTILMAESGEATGLKWVASQTPSTQAFGDAAAEGTADTYSRGDHKHAMPANPVPSGTAFPGGPATNALYVRTNLDCMFWIYDGTRWICTTLHELRLVNTEAVLPLTATGIVRGVAPAWGGSNIWLVDTQTWFFVAGGTALGASHKWVGSVQTAPSVTALASVAIDSGASDAHRQSTRTAIDALLGTEYEIECSWVKTGTPGALYTQTVVSYHHVAT